MYDIFTRVIQNKIHVLETKIKFGMSDRQEWASRYTITALNEVLLEIDEIQQRYLKQLFEEDERNKE